MHLSTDCLFIGLDEFVNKPVVKNRKSDEEVSKVVRKSDDSPIIEDWVSDNEEENVSQPKNEKKIVKVGNPQMDLQDQRVIDNGCSRHMTGNMSYLTDYEEIDGGYVAFGGNPKGGKITRKVRTPQQNEVAERRNRTLIKAARTMLADSKTSTLSFMRPFGCPVTILNTTEHLGKFNGKVDEGFFVGYSLNSKAFRVFNSRTRIVEENLHIRFSESTPNVVGSGLDWLFDIDALTSTMNYKPIVAGTQSNSFAGTKPSDNAGQARKETEPKVDEDPRKDSEYKDQEKEDNVNNANNVNAASTNEVNVVGAKTSIELSSDPNIPALEDINIFDFSTGNEDNDAETDMNNLDTTIQVSHNPTTRIFKDRPLDQVIGDLQSVRLVAQGYTQEEGIDYDEVFAPVARIYAIRLFLAYASFKDFVVYQMDVKSAFLYGNIEEEVHVCQPHRFEDPDFPDRVYKVEKVLYGLHQAPRAWYETLSTYLLDNEFQRGKINKTLFIKRYKGDIFLVQVYVDDIIFGSTKKELCNAFEKLMHEKFQMSSIGEHIFFLGLQKFGFIEVKTASTPMETQKPLLKDKDSEEVDVHMYRSMIGSLMYLTYSRPDIMFAVCVCARYQVNPKVSHLFCVIGFLGNRHFSYSNIKPNTQIIWKPNPIQDLSPGINDEIVDSEKVEANDQIANGGSGDDTNRPSNEFTTYDTNSPSLTKANKQINADCSDKEQVVENVDDTNGYSTSKNVCYNNACGDVNENDKNKETFANVVKPDSVDIENKLSLIPVCVEEGREVVIFDEELVMEGIRKWSLTLCGHFVGFKMSYYELRYNLIRMWGKFGLKEIVTQNGAFLFKFRESEGMDFVLENGPWMVNNKPLIVQKWFGAMLIIDYRALSTSDASGLGTKPFDNGTITSLLRCAEEDHGRCVGVSRESLWKFKMIVEYSWKPPKCGDYKVFGHSESACGLTSGNEHDVAQEFIGKKENDRHRRISEEDLATFRDELGSKQARLYMPFLPIYSDHSPAVLIFPKEHWNIQVDGCKMYKLVKRLKGLKYHMKKFSWQFGNIFEKEAEIMKEYNIARKDEEKLLLQKAKIDWVRHEGAQVAEQFVKHFQNFLGIASSVQNFDMESLNSKTVCDKDAERMIMNVSEEEIKDALFDICDNKAPGLDGYSAKFFKSAWSVIKNEVYEAIMEFFRTMRMTGEVNATLITLVPKSKTPQKVFDYRPIACCNIIYKIISKILTNRIKSALCKLVSQCQSAFILGRRITDNILLTQELLRGYNWKNGARRVALKIDIQKAYDTIN
ncbi:retrovirus-related pol polyprotein from transposon TNT 1-94 [Tanacetum coccineum]